MAGLDLDTAIRLRWALRDIKGKRTKLTPVSPDDLRALLERASSGCVMKSRCLRTKVSGQSIGAEGEGEMKQPVRRRWTRAEEKQLQDLLDSGMTGAEAAKKLKRTRQAIYARLQYLYRKRLLLSKRTHG